MAIIEVLVPTTNDGISVSMADPHRVAQMKKIWADSEVEQLKRVRLIAARAAGKEVSVKQVQGDTYSTIYEIECDDSLAPAIEAEFKRRNIPVGSPVNYPFGDEGRISTEEQQRRLFIADDAQEKQ